MVELTVIPYSTFFILLLSSFLSLVTSLTNRLLTNREQMREWTQEIASWRADSMKATRTGDKKLMAKVKKQQKHVMQLQSKMTWHQMKISFIWFIPLLLLWWFFLTPLYTNPETGPVAVAFLPGIGGEWALTYFYWYFICSLVSQALLSRLLGLGMGGD